MRMQQAWIIVLVANVYNGLVAERKLTQSMPVMSKQFLTQPSEWLHHAVEFAAKEDIASYVAYACMLQSKCGHL